MKNLGRKDTEKTKKDSIFTKETLGVVLVLFSTLCLICLIAGGNIFSAPGAYVSAFLHGILGYFSYSTCIFGIVSGVMLVADKKVVLAKKTKIFIGLSVALFALLLHTITMHSISSTATYGEYLAQSYLMGASGIATCSGGGVLTGLIAFCISRLLTPIGGYIVLGIALALSIYGLVSNIVVTLRTANAPEQHRSSFVRTAEDNNVVTDYTVSGTRDYPVDSVEFKGSTMNGTQRLFVANPDEFALKTKKDIKANNSADIKIATVGNMNVGVRSVAPAPVNNQGVQTAPTSNAGQNVAPQSYQEKLAYIRTPAEIKVDGYEEEKPVEDVQTSVSDTIAPVSPVVEDDSAQNASNITEIPYFEHDESDNYDDSAVGHAEEFGARYASFEEVEPTSSVEETPSQTHDEPIFDPYATLEEPAPSETVEEISAKDILGRLANEDKLVNEEENKEPIVPEPRVRERRSRIAPELKPEIKPEEKSEPEQLTIDGLTEEDSFVFKTYVRPPIDLLATYDPPVDAPKEDHEVKMAIIEDTLHQFKIDAQVAGYVQGPTLTRYELTMPSGKSVKEVGKYDDDLKMRLKSENGIRIEAPIPGMDRVGVEVENEIKLTVGLKKTMEGMAAKPMKDGELRFAIGQDLLGNAIFDNLAAGPHYLVAGSTGSGKSVCLHAMIVSLIMTYGPEDLRIILVNPKKVEFGIYEGLPHLLVNEILNDAAKANAALTWAYDEMQRRGRLFMEHADLVVDITGYNKYIANDKIPKLPRIVIIIDEYADLVSDGKGDACQKEVSSKVAALAQMSRSAGIHLVLATQRPTTNIVTGTIKTNLPSRIALKLTNSIDSGTIIDEPGAEKLLGHGDMLYRNANMSNCKRYQGAYLDRMEIKNVVTFIKDNNETHFNEKLTEMVNRSTQPKEEPVAVGGTSGSDEEPERNLENDPMFLKCLAFGVRTKTMSISALQRHFPVGYNKAAKIFDKIEALGYVTENEGGKARRVLLTQEEFEARYGPLSDYGI